MQLWDDLGLQTAQRWFPLLTARCYTELCVAVYAKGAPQKRVAVVLTAKPPTWRLCVAAFV